MLSHRPSGQPLLKLALGNYPQCKSDWRTLLQPVRISIDDLWVQVVIGEKLPDTKLSEIRYIALLDSYLMTQTP